jgi:imidazolonepropionase-like amidohydrolase
MLIIKNATIQTITHGVIEHGMVAIQSGKIIYIGKLNETLLKKAREIIDGKERLVSPGLIDAHTHLGIDEEGIGWEGDDYNETSSPTTPHMRAIDGINPFEQGLIDASKSGVTTVQVLPGSANVIGGLMTVIKVKPGELVDDIAIRPISGLKIAFGENPKKYHGQKGSAPVTRMGVAALLRSQFTKAQNYLNRRQEQPPQTDIDIEMEALVLALRGEIPVRAHTHRADDIMTAIRIAKEFNLDLSIEHATEGHKVAKALANSGVKVSVGPTLSSRSKVELNDMGWETYSVLEQHGIRFAIITDHPVLSIQYLTTSAKFAVQAGLSIDAAWRGLTIYPAELLGLEDQIGSLEVGKDADLVLWSDDPIQANGKPLLTIVDGQLVYQSEY